MIFHYAGKYNGDESSLPYKEHHPNATPFKEPEDDRGVATHGPEVKKDRNRVRKSLLISLKMSIFIL